MTEIQVETRLLTSKTHLLYTTATDVRRINAVDSLFTGFDGRILWL